MMGISWGGFNCLQVAALKPPALKAVISIASTVDRYNDDIHYKNGTHLSAQLSWAATMLAYQSRAPDPALVGDRWRDMWLERLENEPFFMEEWLQHQRRDDFWQHGSICEDFDGVPGAGAGHRRLGRRLPQHAAEGGRRPGRQGQGADRPLGAQISAFRLAEAARRFPWRGDRLVEPLAARRRQRRREAAAGARLHPRRRRSPRCGAKSIPASGWPRTTGPRRRCSASMSTSSAGWRARHADRAAPRAHVLPEVAARYRHGVRRMVHAEAGCRDGRSTSASTMPARWSSRRRALDAKRSTISASRC